MPWALISLLLAVDPTNPPAPPEQATGVVFPTAKTMEAVQVCLTSELSEVGEIAATQPERDSTILLVRGNPEGPMVIELTPAKVTVTTKFIDGTREIIRGCL